MVLSNWSNACLKVCKKGQVPSRIDGGSKHSHGEKYKGFNIKFITMLMKGHSQKNLQKNYGIIPGICSPTPVVGGGILLQCDQTARCTDN